MRGLMWQAAFVFGVIVVVLLATAHLWAPPLARVLRRIVRNLNIAADALFGAARRLFGQGQTRPQPGEKRGRRSE